MISLIPQTILAASTVAANPAPVVTAAVSNVDTWAEFGVQAVVIGALFTVLAMGFQIFMKTINAQHEQSRELVKYLRDSHAKEIKEQMDQHRVERAQWMASEEKRTELINTSVNRLADAIQTNNNLMHGRH